MRIEVETDVAAPPETVFKVATDIHRWPDIVEGIERIVIATPGTIGVGTRFEETRRMFGREAMEVMTVTEFESPSRFTLSAENHGAKYLATHTFARTAQGTRLRLTFSGEPVTLLAKALTPLSSLMKGQVRRQLESDLAGVKAAAETAHAATV